MGLDCEDPQLIDFATNEDIWEKVDTLAAAWHVESRQEFKKLERSETRPAL